MEFKFKAKVFLNKPEDNKNNNPKYPKMGGTIEMPVSKLKDLVEYLHWATRTELKYDQYLGEQVVPIKISGWNGSNAEKTKKWLDFHFEPGYKVLQAALEAKQASQPQPSVDNAAASLAEGTAGSVVTPDQDFFDD